MAGRAFMLCYVSGQKPDAAGSVQKSLLASGAGTWNHHDGVGGRGRDEGEGEGEMRKREKKRERGREGGRERKGRGERGERDRDNCMKAGETKDAREYHT